MPARGGVKANFIAGCAVTVITKIRDNIGTGRKPVRGNIGYASIAGTGGQNNTASAPTSFAAGQNAHALHPGAFVWVDANGEFVSSTAVNQFVVRATGGVGFISAIMCSSFASRSSSCAIFLSLGTLSR